MIMIVIGAAKNHNIINRQEVASGNGVNGNVSGQDILLLAPIKAWLAGIYLSACYAANTFL